MKSLLPLVLGLIIVSFVAAGCGTPSSETQQSISPKSTTQQGKHSHDEHAHSVQGEGQDSNMARMKAELAKLSPQDAASAEKQHFCPVSGEMLGTMGAPIKLDVKGQQVWICCDACKDQLLEKPDEYPAKPPN